MTQSILLSLLLIPILHTEGNSGALSGFLHPLLGLDHMLAMVAVGLLSAQLGGRAIWTVPATFVVVMAVGGLLGMVGVALPAIESVIALSVIVLGAAIALKQNVPVGVAMIFVALFALFHGYAHGAELPANLNTPLDSITYVIGFLVATAGLHVIGALLGTMAERTERGDRTLRFSGALIAMIGVAIIAGII
jgi:urease accessory protein